jgi:hypothetical protein
MQSRWFVKVTGSSFGDWRVDLSYAVDELGMTMIPDGLNVEESV